MTNTLSAAGRRALDRYGLAAPALPGWSVDVRHAGGEDATLRPMRVLPGRAVGDDAGEIYRPILHASTARLPAERGDFGTGAVQLLGSRDVFVALVDYGPDVADEGLFAAQGMPRLAPSQFDPDNLQRPQANVSAAQHFFSSGGRGFCLFTVVGAHHRRMAGAARAATMVAGIRITPYARLTEALR